MLRQIYKGVYLHQLVFYYIYINKFFSVPLFYNPSNFHLYFLVYREASPSFFLIVFLVVLTPHLSTGHDPFLAPSTQSSQRSWSQPSMWKTAKPDPEFGLGNFRHRSQRQVSSNLARTAFVRVKSMLFHTGSAIFTEKSFFLTFLVDEKNYFKNTNCPRSNHLTLFHTFHANWLLIGGKNLYI